MYGTWGLLLKAMMPMDVPISNHDFMDELHVTKVHFSFMKIFHIHQHNFIHSCIENSCSSMKFGWLQCKIIFVNHIDVYIIFIRWNLFHPNILGLNGWTSISLGWLHFHVIHKKKCKGNMKFELKTFQLTLHKDVPSLLSSHLGHPHLRKSLTSH
jgi:hypothetical protein